MIDFKEIEYNDDSWELFARDSRRAAGKIAICKAGDKENCKMDSASGSPFG